VPGSLDKKRGKKDATFCLIKDGIFFSLFVSNEPGTVQNGPEELSPIVIRLNK
jgi:hypothetical protein